MARPAAQAQGWMLALSLPPLLCLGCMSEGGVSG